MDALKNVKHELFVQKWHETGNKSEAYRIAYPGSLKWKDESVHPKASELSRRDTVSARYKSLQDKTVEEHGITITSLLLELEEARTMALQPENAQSSAAVSATMGKAKLVGLDILKVEVSAKEELTPWGMIFAEKDE
jgi:hypothetical protein